MTETEKKSATKAKAAKPVVAKAAASKASAPAAKAKKVAGEKGTVTVTQVAGSIARQGDQRATLIGLGLNKRHRTRTLEDTPSVRGMIYKVRHLVKVEA